MLWLYVASSNKKKKANGFFLFCPFQVFYHSRHFALLPIYAFTRIFVQWWPPYRVPPTRHEQLGVQLLHSHAQLSLTTPFSYWGWVGELSPLKVYMPGRSSDYRLQLVCLLPLGWPFKTQLDVQHVRGEARIVMLFHAAWCRPTQLCLSQVKAMQADIDHRAPFSNSYWRSLHTLQEESEYDRKLCVSFSDLAKSNFAEDYGLYMHFKTQIIIRVRQDSYYVAFFLRMHRLAELGINTVTLW